MKVSPKAMEAAMRKRKIQMPTVNARTGAPMDSDLGEKREAELPDPQLPVYRGESRKRRGA